MPRLAEVARAGGWIERHLDRVREVAAGSLDRDVEGALEGRLVLRGHQVQAELIAALRRERQADEPARLARHEVDRLGRGELAGHHEVALVLAVLGLADADQSRGADALQRLLERVARCLHSRTTRLSTYLAKLVVRE